MNNINKFNKNAYDAASKAILTNKTILSNIMRECIEEYKGLSIEEIIKCIEDGSDSSHIVGMNTEDIGIKGEKIHFDILFSSKLPNSNERIGMYIDIEPQNDIYLEYSLVSRAIFYACRLIDRQKGEIFKNSNYNDIRKVYSIWIVINPRPEQKDSINLYTIDETIIKGKYHEKNDYKKLNVCMLYLGDKYDSVSKGILEMLNTIFIDNETSNIEKVQKLNDDYGIIISNKEVSDMSSLYNGVLQKGYLQGHEAGIKEGIQLGKVETILTLIKNGISLDNVFSICDLDDSIKQEVLKRLDTKE